jgi:hypothetical protein
VVNPKAREVNCVVSSLYSLSKRAPRQKAYWLFGGICPFPCPAGCDLGENVDKMLAEDTIKNGVEVVWWHLAVNVVPDFIVVVPSPTPWLYEIKVSVLWAGGMRGCIERYAHEFTQAHILSKNLKPCATYLLQKRQPERLAPRLRKRPK